MAERLQPLGRNLELRLETELEMTSAFSLLSENETKAPSVYCQAPGEQLLWGPARERRISRQTDSALY